jgi:hypothetical protein
MIFQFFPFNWKNIEKPIRFNSALFRLFDGWFLAYSCLFFCIVVFPVRRTFPKQYNQICRSQPVH